MPRIENSLKRLSTPVLLGMNSSDTSGGRDPHGAHIERRFDSHSISVKARCDTATKSATTREVSS